MRSNNNIRIIPAEGCSGCTSCRGVCPCDAITMQEDSQGFLYPSVDEDRCIQCGLCLKACPYTKERNLDVIGCYAAKHKNVNDQLSSTSGGFATALGERAISEGGVVYGVIEDTDFQIRTVRADSMEKLNDFKGSKYVQTNLGDVFNSLNDDLCEDRMVVFFGSSCHVDGLNRFLEIKKTKVDNLLTVDFICHGVPSPKVFRSYIDFLKRKYDLRQYYFRTKAKGWGQGSRQYAPSICYSKYDKLKYDTDTLLARAWLNLFFSNTCLRPHCYQCPYAGKGRSADITMADFWGLKNVNPDFYDTNGVSLVLCNTQKGNEAFDKIPDLIWISSTVEEASKKQANMHGPSVKSNRYNEFWDDFLSKDFGFVLKKYTQYNLKCRVKKFIKCLIRKG